MLAHFQSDLVTHLQCVAQFPVDVAFDDTVTPPIIVEGAKKVSKHVRYERNPKNRKEAIKIHGCRCQICGFD